MDTQDVNDTNDSSANTTLDQCEFCDKIFGKTVFNRDSIRRYHIYLHHLKSEIDGEISKWWKKPSEGASKCPMKNCGFFTKVRGNFVVHYIGKTHGILDKLIEIKRNQTNHEKDISNVNDSISKSSTTTTEDCLQENNEKIVSKDAITSKFQDDEEMVSKDWTEQ